MSLSTKYRDEQLTANHEREHIFNMLGIISAAIIVVVFVVAKLTI